MSTTDLEAHVEAPGRADLVKEVRAKIESLGVDYIYYQFISVTGRIVGKGIPSDHWENIAQRGFQLVYGSTANLFTDAMEGDVSAWTITNDMSLTGGVWKPAVPNATIARGPPAKPAR